MTKPTNSLATLLERIEGELQTADGRIARVCRDLSGNYWVVDGAERVVSLNVFAVECSLAARQYYARARAEEMGRLANLAKDAISRVVTNLRRIAAQTAQA